MAEKPVGRARLSLLLGKIPKPGGLPPEGTSGAGTLTQEEDVPKAPEKKPIGRGDFIARMKAKIERERMEKSAGCASNEPKESPSTEPAQPLEQVEKAIEKLSKMKVHKEEDTVGEVHVIEKQGNFGEQKVMSTNYIRLITDPNKRVFEYEICFYPAVASVSCRFKLVYSQFHDNKDMLCYDSGSKLFTPENITSDSVQYKLRHPIDDSEVVMTVIFKKIARAKDSAILYNTLFKNFSRILHMTRFRDKYYDHRAALKIPQHKLEIWPGVVTAVEEFDGGIQLRCDINHRILRTETAHDIIVSIIRRNPQNFKALIEKELLGECVSTRYNNNLYRIDDIEWDHTPTSTFEISNGGTLSFIQYYKKQYNIDIKDNKQPLLISRRKNAQGQKSRLICLVPELCNMTGLTDRMSSDMKVMKDVALYTKVTPAQRAYAFRKFLNNIKNNEEAQEMLRKWGLTIDDEPVKVTGRNLLTERLIFGHEAMVTAVNGDWQKCFRDVTVYKSVDLINWFLFFPEKDIRIAGAFTNALRKVGPGLGIEIAEPNMVSLNDDKNETYVHCLRRHINPDVQMVVCICPTAREDRYSVIKKFCCKEVPVPSQVVNTITLAREDRLRSVVQNIALQMNVKLGGASWAIHVPFKNMMVCGMDTYHDKSNDTAVGGFVASCNLTYTEWFSKTVFQGPKEEIIDGLVNSFSAALSNYHDKYNAYPERIVVYRDGLGDGQLDACREFEIKQFLQACKELNGGINPKFTYVVVRKRISTKIFQTSANNEVDLMNPSPGDVVDNTITNKSFFDFYLVSQFVRVGTATPCHFIVLYDNSSIKPDHIQRLTYKFCHLYYNWAGTIRVPAPCYYAHKLAFLVGQSIKTLPDKSLENKLYYL